MKSITTPGSHQCGDRHTLRGIFTSLHILQFYKNKTRSWIVSNPVDEAGDVIGHHKIAWIDLRTLRYIPQGRGATSWGLRTAHILSATDAPRHKTRLNIK